MEWISVEDSLPNYDKKVLCYYRYNIYVGKFMGKNLNGCKYAFNIGNTYGVCNNFVEYNNVTHWQPLPEAPQEVE